MNYENYSPISSGSSDATEPCRLPKIRSKISAIDKERIIKSYEEGRDLKSVSEILNVNFGSLRNIISKYNRTGSISKGKHGGHRKKIINEEMGDQLLEEIDKKPHMTLEEMKLFFQEKGLDTSTTTISNFLKNRFYTIKKLPYSPFLNPIENYFSQFKSKLRKLLTNNLDLDSSSKFQQIKSGISQVVEDDKNKCLKPYYNNIKYFYPKCLLLKDIL